MNLWSNQKTIRQKQAKKRNKRAFTLIELLLSLMIVAMVGGAFAIQGAKLLKHHQFQNELEHLLNELTLSRHLSQSFRADIELSLLSEKDGVTLIREMDEPRLVKMPHYIAPILHYKHVRLDDDAYIFFRGCGGYDAPEEISISNSKKFHKSVDIKKFLK